MRPGDFVDMTNVPVFMWDQVPPVPQRHGGDGGPSAWTQQGFANGGKQPVPGMHFNPYTGATPVGQPTYDSSPPENIKSAFSVPHAHSAPTYFPPMYPGAGIAGSPHQYTNIHGTFQSHVWPVEHPDFMAMKTRDTVHFQQRCHYHFSACPMTFYNCCTQVCHSVDHYPCAKRPRMNGGNWKAMPEGGITTSGQKTASQVSPAHRTAPRKPLPSPPPLIRKCESDKGLGQKNSGKPHSEEKTEKKFCETAKGFAEHSASFREPSGFAKVSLADSSIRGNEFLQGSYKRVPSGEGGTNRNMTGHQKRETSQQLNVKCDSSPQNNQTVESISCQSWPKQSHKRDIDMESYNTKSVQQHCFPRPGLEETRHCKAMNKESNQNYAKSFLVKTQHDRGMAQNSHSFEKNVSRGGQNSSQTNKNQSLVTTPRDNRENSVNSCDNKTSISDDISKCPAVSSGQHQVWDRDVSKQMQRKQCTSGPSDGIHPQLKYYPLSKINTKRERSKSCDDSSLNSQGPTCRHVKPDVSSYKTPMMQSEKPHEHGLRDKLAEYDGVPIYSLANRRSQRSNSMFSEGTQNARNISTSRGETFLASSGFGMSNHNATQTDVKASYQSVPNESLKSILNRLAYERHTMRPSRETNEAGTTTSIRPAHQQLNIRSGVRQGDEIMSLSQQNQPLSSNRAHVPLYQNRNTASTHGLSRDQSQSQNSPSVAKPTSPGQNRTNPPVPVICGVTSLNELQRRRTKQPDEQNKSKNGHRFDVYYEKDVFLSRNRPSYAQTAKPQEQRTRQPAHVHCTSTDTETDKGHSNATNITCDEQYGQHMRQLPNNETTVVQSPQNQDQLRRYPREECSSNRKLSTPCHEDIEMPIHKVEKTTTSGDCDQAEGRLQRQSTCSESRTLPPLPSENDFDNMATECGGYAIDHDALPRIVAVHSVVAQDEVLTEDESSLFSASDKKYWRDLLKTLKLKTNGDDDFQQCKPHETLKTSHTDSIKNRSEMDTVKSDKHVTPPLENDYNSGQERFIDNSFFGDVKKWTLWKYLSSPSKELTIEVKGPKEYVEVVETEKKRQVPRRKLSVSELSKKILYTRERIKKEAIPWKRKLLFSLEATFIKRLRKTEKETGEKADIIMEEDNAKEESTEENEEKEKCKKQARKKKIATKSAKPRTIMAKE